MLLWPGLGAEGVGRVRTLTTSLVLTFSVNFVINIVIDTLLSPMEFNWNWNFHVLSNNIKENSLVSHICTLFTFCKKKRKKEIT